MWFRKGDCDDCAAKNRTKKPPFLFGFYGVCRINKSGCINTMQPLEMLCYTRAEFCSVSAS